jgi:hypothetical protein
MENVIHTLLILFFSFTLFLFSSVTVSYSQFLGSFENHSDIGTDLRAGSVFYDAGQQIYTVEGSGTNMWFDRDEFHFVWKRIKGNFILSAEIQFTGAGVEPHRKTGWIVRSDLDPQAVHVNATVHGDGLTSLQFRKTTAGNTEEIPCAITDAGIVQL